MAALPSERLTSILLSALPGANRDASPNAPKPIVLTLPKIGQVRIYLWTVTPDQSATGRPPGEHKIQIIVPGAGSARQHLELEGMPTFIMGYSPFHGVFVIWEAARHQDSSYSKNIQVQGELLDEAVESGWAIAAPRRTEAGPEVRTAIHPAHLPLFLRLAIKTDSLGLEGKPRQEFFEAGAPELETPELIDELIKGKPIKPEDVERARTKAIVTRIKREAGFSKLILDGFDHHCAVCEIQLTILDGAHIVPVHASGADEQWNGLALCRNHHRLYDRRIILIDDKAIVRADDETLKVLDELGRLGGFQEVIGKFRNKKLNYLPAPYGKDADFTNRMNGALGLTFSRVG